MVDKLMEDESGAIRIGPTDAGMVRFIISTPSGVYELDFPPDEAEEIADELLASAELARGGAKADGKRRGRGPSRN